MGCIDKKQRQKPMIDYDELKPGVSGIMRVKDDAQFIEPCILSCIEALDELVIVYNDCTDSSPQVIEQLRSKYPEKISVYPYNHHIMALNLSEEEYEFVKGLPDDDPRLLCNYYNFALEKVSRQYAVKIDADQMYFSEKLKQWCDILRSNREPHWLAATFGALIFIWMKLSYRINRALNRVTHTLPAKMPLLMKDAYHEFVRYAVKKDKACVMLSGVNVVNIKGEWHVPWGKKTGFFNILPPFNGIGDHVFFKVKPECHYIKFDCPEYSKHRSDSYSIIERFICPDIYLVGGYFWFHLNMTRPEIYNKVIDAYNTHPGSFVKIEDLVKMSYYDMDCHIPINMFGMDSKSLMQFVYPYSKDDIIDNLSKLRERN